MRKQHKNQHASVLLLQQFGWLGLAELIELTVLLNYLFFTVCSATSMLEKQVFDKGWYSISLIFSCSSNRTRVCSLHLNDLQKNFSFHTEEMSTPWLIISFYFSDHGLFVLVPSFKITTQSKLISNFLFNPLKNHLFCQTFIKDRIIIHLFKLITCNSTLQLFYYAQIFEYSNCSLFLQPLFGFQTT